MVFGFDKVNESEKTWEIGVNPTLRLAHPPRRRVISGIFHPSNPAKEFMDYVLEWNLIHRTEADMNRLFANSLFKKPCSRIQFEALGINLFAECRKD
jgi:extracellular factor (EF) 3-hydroxypalmitic acid methyl ester biosynthesis protein